MLAFAAVVGALAIHLFLYDVVASYSVTIGRIASPLYAPAVAVVIYLVARYDTFSSRFFSSPYPRAIWRSELFNLSAA